MNNMFIEQASIDEYLGDMAKGTKKVVSLRVSIAPFQPWSLLPNLYKGPVDSFTKNGSFVSSTKKKKADYTMQYNSFNLLCISVSFTKLMKVTN